jgi:hypothetical protein
METKLDNHEWSAEKKMDIVYFVVAGHYSGDWNRDSRTFLISENFRLQILREPPAHTKCMPDIEEDRSVFVR